MKHIQRLSVICLSISLFFITLFVSLVSIINNPKFYQKIWQEEGIYEQMNISEEELTKVIVHTMDYMWGKEDDLQVNVTLNDGTSRDFYVNWGEDYDGKLMDELAHMEECRVLFLAGKDIMIYSCIIAALCVFALFQTRHFLSYKTLNLSYITYGVILGLSGVFAVLVITNFDACFDAFHEIFFSDSNISFTFYASSFMIQMLPEYAIFNNIVYKTLIHFFSFFAIIIISTILIQKRLKKSNQS